MAQGIVAREAARHPGEKAKNTHVSSIAHLDPASFITMVRRGLSGQVVKQAVNVIGRALVVRLLETTSGNLHRLYLRKTLKPTQSEALLDTLRVFSRAQAVFGDTDRAREWMGSRLLVFGSKRPLDLCDTFEGRRLVQDALRRIEDGEFP